MKKISLLHLKSGKRVKIAEINGGDNLRNRLMSMGIYVGRDITKISHFGFKGPVPIRVGRTVVAIGHEMAKKILLEINE